MTSKPQGELLLSEQLSRKFVQPIQSIIDGGNIINHVTPKIWFVIDDVIQKEIIPLIEAHTARVVNEVRKEGVTGETSDGYHTFNELYEYRKVYNALLFNEWYSQGKYGVHKSKRHSDGELCFGGGWFIVVAQLPSGQVSNHYELKDWDLFKIAEREIPVEYDGHTPQEAMNRMIAELSTRYNQEVK